MPPARKRTTRRFTFDFAKYPNFSKISGRLRALITQQRRELREATKPEYEFREALRLRIAERNEKYIAPQTKEERCLRLQGIEQQLNRKREARGMLLNGIAKLDSMVSERRLIEIERCAKEDQIRERREHMEYLREEQTKMEDLYENLVRSLKTAERENKKRKEHTMEGAEAHEDGNGEIAQHSSAIRYGTNGSALKRDEEISKWSISENAEKTLTSAQLKNRSILNWIESLGNDSTIRNLEGIIHQQEGYSSMTEPAQNDLNTYHSLRSKDANSMPPPAPLSTILSSEKKIRTINMNDATSTATRTVR